MNGVHFCLLFFFDGLYYRKQTLPVIDNILSNKEIWNLVNKFSEK